MFRKHYLLRRKHIYNVSTVPFMKLIPTSTTAPKTTTKSGGTVIKKMVTFWKTLLNDYKEVFLDSLNSVKENPKKSVFLFCVFGATFVCAKLNPDDIHFRDTVINNSHKISLLGPAVRNPVPEEHLKLIENYYNKGLIRRISFGVFSVILVKHKSDATALYKENCTYLQPSYLSMISNNILDVGFLNRWWVIENKMIDYDINPQEWV